MTRGVWSHVAFCRSSAASCFERSGQRLAAREHAAGQAAVELHMVARLEKSLAMFAGSRFEPRPRVRVCDVSLGFGPQSVAQVAGPMATGSRAEDLVFAPRHEIGAALRARLHFSLDNLASTQTLVESTRRDTSCPYSTLPGTVYLARNRLSDGITTN